MTNVLLWQLADSAFPSGSLAHSAGLEAVHQFVALRCGEDLAAVARDLLVQTSHASLPFARAAYEDPSRLAELDQTLDAFLTNHVANRASRAQGRAWLSSVGKVFGVAAVHEVQQDMKRRQIHGHLAPFWGAILSALGASADEAPELFMFTTLRSFLSSAVRLGIVGPLEAQSIQASLSAECARLARTAVTVEDAAQTSPMLDLLQGTQDRLYSRLFQS